MKGLKVIHVVNGVGPGSIPLEVAARSSRRGMDVRLIAYYTVSDKDRNDAAEFLDHLELTEIGVRSPLDISGTYRLYREIREANPDILHVHHNMSGSVARIAGRLAGVPAIIDTEHNDHNGFRRMPRFLNGLTLNLAHKIVCNSENTCESFLPWEDILVREEKKSVIYNGVDLEKVEKFSKERDITREDFGLSDSDFVIGNVGMFTEQKDQISLIRAMKDVVDRVSGAKLVLVGDGPLRDRLEEEVSTLGLEDRVVFPGLLEREKVYQLLHLFDIFCMVSLWEGFCNALVEAMVAENPVIVTEIEPLPEVAGDAGKYVSPGDTGGIAEEIIELSRDAEGREKLARAGRKRATSKFSLDRSVEKYKDLYLNSLNHGSRKGIDK